MNRRNGFLFAALVCFAAAGNWPASRALAADKPDVPATLSEFSEKVLPFIVQEAAPHIVELLKLAESQTETRVVDASLIQSPFLENLELTAPIRERRKMTMRISNSVLGNELPGEYVISVHTDVVVKVSMTIKDIHIRADSEVPGSLIIQLPRMKTRVEIPEEPNEYFESIRVFRPEDKRKETEVRGQLIDQAKSMALQDTEARLSSWHNEIAEEIRSNLRTKFPKVRISVR